jgi:hypothetical protein
LCDVKSSGCRRSAIARERQSSEGGDKQCDDPQHDCLPYCPGHHNVKRRPAEYGAPPQTAAAAVTLGYWPNIEKTKDIFAPRSSAARILR